MTTPTLSGIFGGWGAEDRGRALAYENRPRLYCVMNLQQFDYCQQKTLQLTGDEHCNRRT
jgi:hypothetical protein